MLMWLPIHWRLIFKMGARMAHGITKATAPPGHRDIGTGATLLENPREAVRGS